MQIDFAEYIKALESSSQETTRAEDRSLYTKYLAEAGVILSAIVLGSTSAELASLISSHDRLWGQTWLIDPVYEKAAKSYQAFKQAHNF